MDPNATLKEMLELVASLQRRAEIDQDALDLAERVEALDNWLRAGGFLPRRWQNDPAGLPR